MRKTLALLSTLLLAAPVGTFASVNDDQVTSQKIKEADGSSGQNTNSGSGVKTNHIQNAAVTNGKLADGAVNGAKILDGSVTNSDLAAGSVTDAKISGPISASKISTNGLNADTVDGVHAADFAAVGHAHAQSDVTGLEGSLAGKSDAAHTHGVTDVTGFQEALDAKSDLGHAHSAADITSGTLGVERLGSYAGVKIVHKGPADGVNSFNTISAALAAITDASPSNRYAVLLMPGIYPQTAPLVTTDYVDIVGQSRAGSVIQAVGTDDNMLRLESNTTLSNLTIESPAGRRPGVFVVGSNNAIEGCDVLVHHGAIGIMVWKNSGGQGRTSVNNVRITGDGAVDYQGGTGLQLELWDPIDIETDTFTNIDIRGPLYQGVVAYTNWETTATVRLSGIKVSGEVGRGVQFPYGNFRIADSDIDLSGSSCLVSSCFALMAGSAGNTYAKVEVSSSRVAGYGGASGQPAVWSTGELKLDACTVAGAVTAGDFGCRPGVGCAGPSSILLCNTKIAGDRRPEYGGTIKVVNCSDASYDPIPNGVYQ